MSKGYVLRSKEGGFYAGAPYSDHFNLDKAKVWRSLNGLKQTNEVKHWGYEIVPVLISIELAPK